MIVGAFTFATYEAAPLELNPGDVLLAYSDGLTEAENPQGEMLGEEGVKQVISERSALRIAHTWNKNCLKQFRISRPADHSPTTLRSLLSKELETRVDHDRKVPMDQHE